MSEYDYDFFVIGAGSGGVRAARIAASLGARVAVAEADKLGGTCVNVGCVPKKLLVYGSHFAGELEDAMGYGWDVGESSFDWATLIQRKNVEIERLNAVYLRLLETSGCDLVYGRATLVDRHTVEVNGQRHRAAHILVATGSWPFVPDVPGKEHAITSNEAFYLSQLPGRAVLVGAGYIAVEFGGVFHGLGSEVHLVFRGDRILRGFDSDVRDCLTHELSNQGIHLRRRSQVASIAKADDGELTVTLADGGTIRTDLVMFATGRNPNTRGIGLEALGVELADNGAVVVDDYGRTSVDGIYAIGDNTDRITLTPMAIAEGQALAETLFGAGPRTASRVDVPSAVFSQPPIGTVGLTEEEARERYGEVDVYRSTFKPMRHTLSGRDERALMKLIVDRESDRVVGCHMAGPDAPEIVQGFAVALKVGATKAQFDATIGIHPTAAEEFVTMRTPLTETPRAERPERD
ncbi:MAG: glutathione-disulfide reductase [Myxococcales bacterium]|nr:glutathione-disulfide reductase [Myxococcales bacterium]